MLFAPLQKNLAKLLLIGVILPSILHSQPINDLQGFYRNGQVFLTWTNNSNASAFYKVYRSTAQITSGRQLSSCEYLGWVNNQSAINHNLTKHDKIVRYLRLDSAGTPLASNKGLFVATTLVNGNYFYAVTLLNGTTEDTTIIAGTNSLASSISETIAVPQPVYQEQRMINSVAIDIYATFHSSKYAMDKPLAVNAGFLTYDFAVNKKNASSMNPLKMTFHPGGSDFLTDIDKTTTNEIKLNMEDFLPDTTITLGWWGSNPSYDVYNNANNTSNPTSGVNVNYDQWRITAAMDWAIKRFPIDTNRIYFSATSAGAPGAYFYTIHHPERIAALELHVGVFNFAFQNDWQANCSLNPGKENRVTGDERVGMVATNLSSNLGLNTYDVLNGGEMIYQFPEDNYPFIYSINGKQDNKVGWTEKTIYYDSVNANHLGGYYFWDNRDHGGTSGTTWADDNFNVFRFRRNASYPAFANCSNNEDFGNGNGNTGANHGTVNGSLDWNDNIIDDTLTWQLKAFVRNLIDKTGKVITYPDSATADVTPRRLQEFSLLQGRTITWSAKHGNQVIQSGSILYDGGVLVIPQVKIFRDTTTILLTASPTRVFYPDADGDGYGNSSTSIVSATQPSGYVSDHSDCNDANALLNPGRIDICNGIDDNCSGVTDENFVSASLNAPPSTPVCGPASIGLTPVINGPVVTYQWMVDNSMISGATAPSYSATSSGNYSLTVSNSACSDTSNIVPLTILVPPPSNVNPAGTVVECKGFAVTLTAPSGSDLQYQWLKNGNVKSGETSSTYVSGKKESGTFSVQITDQNGCSVVSPETEVDRLEQPDAIITPIGNLDICSAGSVTLQANAGSSYTYQWQKGSNILSGATKQTYVATQTGNFKVVVTNSNNCSKTSKAIKVTSSCKIDVSEENISVKIYPIPSDGNFQISFSNIVDDEAGILEIYDATGRRFYSQELTISSPNSSKEFSLHDLLPNGNYIVHFTGSKTNFSQLIVVAK